MASLPARVWRAFTSPVADTADSSKVGSAKWNADLNVFLGTVCDALSKLDVAADKLAYFTGGSAADLTALTAFGRLVIAANDNATARTLIGAVGLAGDTMTGNLNFGGLAKVTGLADPTSPTDAANKAYVDALATLVSGALIFKGAWDASAGTFPTPAGRKIGWFYKVSVAGTVNGVSFSVGDDLFAIVDSASGATYAGNWLKIEGSITQAEVEAAIGFTFGSLAALSSITTAYISDMSANAKSLVTAANYAAMKALLAIAQADVTGLKTTDSPTFAGLLLNGLLHFAGATATEPMLKRVTTSILARLGDDSAYAGLEAATPAPGDNSNKVSTTAYALAALVAGGLDDTAFVSTFVPTVIAASGALTTASAQMWYKKRYRTVYFTMIVTVTTNGTGSGALQTTVPFASAAHDQAVNGTSKGNITGAQVGRIPASSTTLYIQKYDATYPAIDGSIHIMTGHYEANA